jgi:hypothetical protein
VLRRLGLGSRQRNREDAKAVEPIQPWIAWNVSEVYQALGLETRCAAPPAAWPTRVPPET